MQSIKIEKRIAEQLDGIRKLAAGLPAGKANALLNKCSKISSYAKKAQAMVDLPVSRRPSFLGFSHASYDARTEKDIAAQYNAQKAVYEAMMAGRKISLENTAEFRISQMHTTIHYIRKQIEDHNLPVVLCDEWYRADDSRRPYKRYWLVPKEAQQ